MTEAQTKIWMRRLATDSEAKLPKVELIWALRRLEEEFDLRRLEQVAIAWWTVAFQSAGGLAFAVGLSLAMRLLAS